MLRRSGAAVTFSSTYERVAALVGVVVMSRFLTPAQIGAFALALAIITVTTQLTDLGAPFALISRPVATHEKVWAHAIVQCARTALVLVIAFAVFPLVTWLAGNTFAWLLIAVAAMQLLIAAGSTSRLLLEKEFRFSAVAIVNVLAATLALGVGIGLAVQGAGLWALVLGFSTPSIVGSCFQTIGFLLARPLGWRRAVIDPHEIRWYVTYGRTLWVGTQAATVTLYLDILMVGLVGGQTMLGFYERARRLTDTPVALVNATAGRLGLSLYSRLQQLPTTIVRAQDAGAALMLRLALPATALMLIAAPELVSVLLGPHWAKTATYLRLLAPFFLLRVVDENLLAYFLGIGRTWERKVGWVIIGALCAILVPPLVVAFGATGAAIALSVSMGTGVAWQQSQVAEARAPREAFRPLVASALAAVVAYAAVTLVGASTDWMRLAMESLTLAVVYGLLLVLLERRRLVLIAREFRASAAGALASWTPAPLESR